jgi:hypothetical protein
MTRPDQKAAERHTLAALLSALALKTDDPREGETPDFELLIDGRTIGVEMTMFQSGTIVGAGLSPRQVESAWEQLEKASRAFRADNPDIGDVNVGLMFKAVAPGRQEQPACLAEVAAFIRARAGILTEANQAFWAWQFTSPLMGKYLQTLHLRRSEFAEWYSNVAAGWVGRPDDTLTKIVREKAAKRYRPTDELWLAIQCSHRISETLLAINGAADFDSVPELAVALQESPFERTFVLTFTRCFQWTRTSGWQAITAQPPKDDGMSLDQLKGLLSDPEWLADPHAKAEKVARRVLEELRLGKKDG